MGQAVRNACAAGHPLRPLRPPLRQGVQVRKIAPRTSRHGGCFGRG